MLQLFKWVPNSLNIQNMFFYYHKEREASFAKGLFFLSEAPFVIREKSCPGQEGHPPSRVNFSKRFYERNVDPFAQVKS